MDEVKKAGRPTKYGSAMPPAERMRKYRLRKLINNSRVNSYPADASDTDLAHALDDAFKHPHPDQAVQLYVIGRLLKELCNRYKITPAD